MRAVIIIVEFSAEKLIDKKFLPNCVIFGP
jgi:hypothetical protein